MKDITIADVRALPGDSAFLIDDGKTSIMYDSGFAFTGYEVADKIKEVLGDRSLDYIFLTHSHYDHTLGSVYAKKYWKNAKVVAGEYAAKIFSKPTAKALMRDLDQKFAKTSGVEEYEDLIDDLCVDIAAKDGDVIKAGDMEFQVIGLPGHTKCSVGFYCKEKKLLLGSETIGVFDGVDDVVPSYLVGYKMAMESIDRVSKLDIENILVPHFGIIDRETTLIYLKKAKENAVEVAEKIAAMLKAGISKDKIAQWYMERFYNGYIKDIYPIDAITLNTGITIDLIARELLGNE